MRVREKEGAGTRGRNEGPQHVTCTELQVLRDEAPSCCGETAIKIRFGTRHRTESFDGKTSIVV